MGKFNDALNATMRDPQFGLAIGLLSGTTPGTSFGQAAQQGLMNSQSMIGQQAKLEDLRQRTGLMGREQDRREYMSMQPPPQSAFMEKANWALENPEQAKTLQDLGVIGGGGVNIETNVGVGPSLTPGQKKVDEQYAADYLGQARGKGADSAKMIAQLDEALVSLQSGQNLTGPITSLLPDRVRALFNENSISTREAVEEVVQRNLKEILGAQFTEKEGAALIARAYNEKLSEEENAKRLGRLIKQMRSAYEMKAEAQAYYEQNGTLQGYQGRVPSIEDFYVTDDSDDTPEVADPLGIRK